MPKIRINYRGGERVFDLEFDDHPEKEEELRLFSESLNRRLLKDRYFEKKLCDCYPIVEYLDPQCNSKVELNESSAVEINEHTELFLRFQPLVTPPKVSFFFKRN